MNVADKRPCALVHCFIPTPAAAPLQVLKSAVAHEADTMDMKLTMRKIPTTGRAKYPPQEGVGGGGRKSPPQVGRGAAARVGGFAPGRGL